MFRNNFLLRSRISPLPKVIRNNKAYANHDGSFHMGLTIFFFFGSFVVFGYWLKVAFKKAVGWERASMPSRQEQYENSAWVGGVANAEFLETTMDAKSHKGPKSPAMLARARREVLASRREDEEQ